MSQLPQLQHASNDAGNTNPLVDMILRIGSPASLQEVIIAEDIRDSVNTRPSHQVPNERVTTNDADAPISASPSRTARHSSTSTVAPTAMESAAEEALVKIRSIMCGLHDQHWVPTFLPYLSDRMIFELFWPATCLPPTLAELETVPSQLSPAELMRTIGDVLLKRYQARMLRTNVDPAVRETETFWLRHDAISMRFDDPAAEGEYCIHHYRHRLRGAVLSFCVIIIIVINVARSPRLENAWRIERSTPEQRERNEPRIHLICSIVPVAGLTCLAALFLVCAQYIKRHDNGIQQLSRNQLQFISFFQEIGAAIATAATVALLGSTIVNEWWCPSVDSDEGKVLHCISNVGYTAVTFLVMLVIPIVVFPMRFAATLILYLVMVSEFLLIHALLFTDDAAAMIAVKHMRQSSSSLVVCRIVYCLIAAIWLLYFKWKKEKVQRLEFAMACKLEATSLELRHLRQILSDQFTAAVPAFVARKLILGSSVRQDNAHAVILTAGMSDAVSLLRTRGPSELVTLLNSIFFALDQCINDPTILDAKIEKMQTLGDTYTCVFGLHSQRTPFEHEMLAALPVMRRLASSMLFVTAAVTPLSVGLHIGQATGVVLGKSLTYVAVGSGIRECLLLMRKARRRGVVTSQEFDEAQASTSGLDVLTTSADTLNNTQAAPAPPPALSPLDTSAAQRLGDEELAELQRVQGLTSAEHYHFDELESAEAARAKYDITCHLTGPSFNDPALEAEYIANIVETVTPIDPSIRRSGCDLKPTFLVDVYGAAHRTVYTGALMVAIINIGVFIVMDAPCYANNRAEGKVVNSTNYEIILALWGAIAVIAVVALCIERRHLLEVWIQEPFARSSFRDGTLLVMLGLHNTGYALLSTSSLLMHNVMAEVALIALISICRITGNPIIAILQDVFFLGVPMLLIQLQILKTSDAESADSSGRFLSFHDKNAILTSWLVTLGMMALCDAAYRLLADLDRRQEFATRHSLAQETKQLEAQRHTMTAYVDTIVPKFAAETFQQFVIHHQVHMRRARDFVHPWLGSWFATKVMDLPIIVLRVSAPANPSTCSREQCQQHQHSFEHSLDTTEPQSATVREHRSSEGGKKHSFLSTATSGDNYDLSSHTVPHVQRIPEEDCSIEQRGYVERLQHVYDVVDKVLAVEPYRSTVCKAKSAGDVVILTTSCVDENTTRTRTLLECGASMMHCFAPGPCEPRMVLHSGLLVGAVIGTDRLTFELFGEPVATSWELLEAMHYQGFIVTDRVAQELDDQCGGSPLLGASDLWKVRGGQNKVRVHYVTVPS